jgi:hypothetical protein
MANQDAGIARERMESARWENGPCTMASAGEGKEENPMRRNVQEAFPVSTEEEERNYFNIIELRWAMKSIPLGRGIG